MKVLFAVKRVFSASLFLLSLVLQGCATTNLEATPAIRFYESTSTHVSREDEERSGRLKVLTLNLAHGRGDSFHQLLQQSSTTIANLDVIDDRLRPTFYPRPSESNTLIVQAILVPEGAFKNYSTIAW